ncbi:MAG: NOL1/NOP2/sun family putative RNA methylase [Clostridiales bacterium]|nr:NOL1/NOP2/sun family putative RNA methylase [Clostridiales bacterium]
MILPKLFEERMKTLLGDNYSDFCESYNKSPKSGLRVNTLKTTPEKFQEISPFEISPVPWTSNGFFYDNKEQPAKHPYYYAGLYYIQEPSAMTPASLLDVKPGDKVLDLCAAPGGKSTELGAKLLGKGVLVANDISSSRAKALLKNIELFGIKNALILSETHQKLESHFYEYFDKILVDAPCSGEGMFRKMPNLTSNWKKLGVDHYNKMQKDIIISAAKMLKPGGLLLYSTCTFSPEENEGTIKYLLEAFPEFELIDPLDNEASKVSYEGFERGRPDWVDGPEELNKTVRLWPHKIDGEGHFVALLRKCSTSNQEIAIKESKSKGKNYDKLNQEAIDFIDQLGMDKANYDIELYESSVYLVVKDMPDTKGLRIMRKGLYLGEMKKKRFEPSQALANALKLEEYPNIINLTSDDPNVIKYLKGETITVEGNHKNGLVLICVDGFPLGWGKLNKQTIKNKYLPAWRWL